MASFPRFKPGQSFGVQGQAGRIVLDEAAASLLNEAAAELRRLGNVSARPPLTWAEEPGRRLGIDLPPQMWALLGGAGAPYTAVEQLYEVGTGWIERDGGRTVEAWEYNTRPDLAGNVYLIHYEPTSNDWRFQDVHEPKLVDCNHLPEQLYFRSSLAGNNGSGSPGNWENFIYDSPSGLWVGTTTFISAAGGHWFPGTIKNGSCSSASTLPTYVVVQMNSSKLVTCQVEACKLAPSTLGPDSMPANSPPGSLTGSNLFGPACTTISRGTYTQNGTASCTYGPPLRISRAFGINFGTIEITDDPATY